MVDPSPTSISYKLIYYLRRYFDITLILLSKKSSYTENDYANLGIMVYSFNFKGEGYIKNKKIIAGLAEVFKFIRLIKKIKKNKYDYIFVRTEPNLAGEFFFKLFNDAKKVYYPYDIFLFRQKDKERLNKFEVKAEKYCFKNADLIIHKGPKDELSWIKNNEIPTMNGKINFLPYCFDAWITKNKKKVKGIHLVYKGGLNSERKFKINYKQVFDTMARGGLDIEIYSSEYIGRQENKRVHIHYNRYEYPNLIKEIGKYHYGINVFFHNKTVDPRWKNSALSNKFFSFLEAGLPIIVNDELTFMADLVKKYNCGVVITEKDFYNLKNVLKKQNYKKLLAGVEKARNELLMSKQISRLANSINSL